MAYAEVLRRIYAAAPEGEAGVRQVAEELDPEFELHEFQNGPDANVYRGREGFVAWFLQGFEVFDEATFEPVELTEHGEVAFVTVEVRAVGHGSELPVTMVVHHVWDMRDGRPWRVRGYLDAAEARAAAGLD